jgi:hypothetical protein
LFTPAYFAGLKEPFEALRINFATEESPSRIGGCGLRDASAEVYPEPVEEFYFASAPQVCGNKLWGIIIICTWR